MKSYAYCVILNKKNWPRSVAYWLKNNLSEARSRFYEAESDVMISTNKNEKQMNKVVGHKRKGKVNNQYSWKEYMEISDILDGAEDNELN